MTCQAMTTDGTPPIRLENFQRQFGDYLRTQTEDLFQGVPLRVSTLYQSLIFNNVQGFLNRCFPVCHSLVDTATWQHVCHSFFAKHACASPYFSEINQNFVDFLMQEDQLASLGLPEFFAELAHYEWMELRVDTHSGQLTAAQLTLPEGTLTVHPTLHLLHYHWPVHRIQADTRSITPQDTFFLIFRNAQNHVEFIKISALTYALVSFLQHSAESTIDSAVNHFWKMAALSPNETAQADARNILIDLLDKDALLYR